MSELVYNVKKGQIRESDIPIVVKESNLSQTLRFGMTFGVFAIVCLMMIISLEKHSMVGSTASVERGDVDADPSYQDIDINFVPFISGSRIQISSDEDVEIHYISPMLLGEDFGPSNPGHEYIMSVLKRGDSGSLYELNLTKDEAITQIAILSPENSKLSKLSTAKVIIRNKEGKKVWQSCQFLKPTKLNIIKVRSS